MERCVASIENCFGGVICRLALVSLFNSHTSHMEKNYHFHTLARLFVYAGRLK